MINITIDSFHARPPIHALAGHFIAPVGLTPSEVRNAYHLPASGGVGTIAIIDAYHSPSIEKDLSVFDTHFGIPACTTKNGCLTIHSTGTKTGTDTGWAMETALDVEWAHAIAPKANILLVEAKSDSGPDLLKAVDYAVGQKDVISVSMSWGGNEFKDETSLDTHFIDPKTNHSSSTVSSTARHIVFFASSGDDGAGVSWPAVSPNVIAVGGTSLSIDATGAFISEKAWAGSGGGVSMYETEPTYQKTYSIPRALGKRAIPDVSFAADPDHGFSVYHNGWSVVGGTSAGAPQWAAIASLSTTSASALNPAKLYADKASTANEKIFRDIISGKNGTCAYYCQARARYDYVTGLGSPLTSTF